MITMWSRIRNSRYSVSTNGEVRNDATGRILKTYETNGYKNVKLRLDTGRTSFKVHRLVAEAFLPDFDQTMQVDHINRVRSDNRVENLRMSDIVMNQNNRIGSVGVVEHIIQLHESGYTVEQIYSTLSY